jgi:multidrug efflux pump subunit AcrA (membrane-fusion protein)
MKSFMFKKPISRIMLPILAVFMLAFAINTVTQKDIAQAAMPTIPPASSKFAQTVAGVGIIEPKSELISVGTFMPGVVMEVYRKVGEDVKKGDLVIHII